MSGGGAPKIGLSDASALRVAIVASMWHEQLMNALVDGAKRCCSSANVVPTIVRVPGAFELPVVASALASSGEFDALICLGVVIRGGTPHFEFVCQGVTYGLTKIAVENCIPVGFGILTTDDEQQALDRSGLPGSREDKGFEAAEAAIATALTLSAFSV